MKNEFQKLEGFAVAQCERITGKTLLEWDVLFLERRNKASRDGKFKTDKFYTSKQVDDFCRFYGVDDDVFERVIGKCDHPLKSIPNSLSGVPVVRIPEQMIRDEKDRLRSIVTSSEQLARIGELNTTIVFRLSARFIATAKRVA